MLPCCRTVVCPSEYSSRALVGECTNTEWPNAHGAVPAKCSNVALPNAMVGCRPTIGCLGLYSVCLAGRASGDPPISVTAVCTRTFRMNSRRASVSHVAMPAASASARAGQFHTYDERKRRQLRVMDECSQRPSASQDRWRQLFWKWS